MIFINLYNLQKTFTLQIQYDKDPTATSDPFFHS